MSNAHYAIFWFTDSHCPGTLLCEPGMCWRMPRRNVVSNHSPWDLVNVNVKLDMDSSFGRWICWALESQHYNIGSKTLLAELGKFTSPASTSTCPTTLLNKGELYGEESAQNITCWAEQVRVLFCLPHCPFCQIHLQQGKWLCCMLHFHQNSSGYDNSTCGISVSFSYSQHGYKGQILF